MGRASRWWKCDLQIATPPWNFRVPPGTTADWSAEADCRAFAEQYVQAICAHGIEVVALANHNRADSWIDYMRDAAADQLVVLPGMEITSGSGQDGVHLIIIGAQDCATEDLERVLYGPCGYSADHPLFSETGEPLPSPRTLGQILDELGEDFLVIAPHALNDNGIASESTVKGSLRWKALHHQRLNAIDVGTSGTGASSGSFNSRFRGRELSDFPCLEWMPFVATSDAYKLDDLGGRFTWIRMASPTIEALRQAFLDHEARVIPSWDPRVANEQSPNDVGHAWIESIELSGISNSTKRLSVEFDPHLNVIVGGRGSGKSTIVNGLLQSYGSPEQLPPAIQNECSEFAQTVLKNGQVNTTHRLPTPEPNDTQPLQKAVWKYDTGSLTERSTGPSTLTEFSATIICQKELFERTSSAAGDPEKASASLLQLVDSWAGIIGTSRTTPSDLLRRMESARRDLEASIRTRVEAESEGSQQQRDAIQGRIDDVRTQLQYFDSDAATERRAGHEEARTIQHEYVAIIEDRQDAFRRINTLVGEKLAAALDTPAITVAQLADVNTSARSVVSDVTNTILGALNEAIDRLAVSRN
ncbi:AAA family ATPase [Candidatus Poriferisodalis sp.]|uniref:AAA family ATPase n=1 Tax=Candidatus Poriferisodalis sp. TaxID=3101277 RepID=UPI003D11B81C